MAKRPFKIDNGKEVIDFEGYAPDKVAIKYLMKRRRSLLSTKDPAKVEKLFQDLPGQVKVMGKQVTKTYKVARERVSTGEFAGARFSFTLDEV